MYCILDRWQHTKINDPYFYPLNKNEFAEISVSRDEYSLLLLGCFQQVRVVRS